MNKKGHIKPEDIIMSLLFLFIGGLVVWATILYLSDDNIEPQQNIVANNVVANRVYANDFIKTYSCEDTCISECGNSNSCMKYCLMDC